MREFHVHKRERAKERERENRFGARHEAVDAVLDGEKADGKPVHGCSAAACSFVVCPCLAGGQHSSARSRYMRMTCAASCLLLEVHIVHSFLYIFLYIFSLPAVGALVGRNRWRPSRAVYIFCAMFSSWKFIPICLPDLRTSLTDFTSGVKFAGFYCRISGHVRPGSPVFSPPPRHWCM